MDFGYYYSNNIIAVNSVVMVIDRVGEVSGELYNQNVWDMTNAVVM